MARIRVGLLPSSSFMVGTLPVPKYADAEKTKFAVDRETGEKLYTITLFFMEDDRAEALKVSVPESGLPNGLKPGVPVMPVELFATPWARMFNGQLSDGVAYRAERVDLIGGLAPAADAA
ncbi:SCO3933 family regulatory protein [Streptomyces griseoaurantiacus]|uniref:SCO3933 family regulatory protein n=1 Tax=Streptomyces griseoaurantiacus TaxID=68213 RepID=UPI0034603D91